MTVGLAFDKTEPRDNRGRWFHGTNDEHSPGDVITGASFAHRRTRGGPGDENWAWVSNDPIRAGAYGAHIYEVEPAEPPRHTRGPDDEHRVSSARVVREVPYDEARRLSPSYQAQARAYERQRNSGLTAADRAGIELGWRFNPLEARDAHGQWTRGGAGYTAPDPERLIIPHPRKNSRFAYYRAPTDHPFFKAHPVSAVNVVKSFDAATPEEKAQGMRWYADAHTLAGAIAHGDHAKGAGVLAAYSPQTAWPVNMFNAAKAIELNRALGPGDGMITRTMQANAQEALDGVPLDQNYGRNTAPKIRAFAHLIANGGDAPDDTTGNVVIDRHAMSVAMGERLPKKEADLAPIGTDRYYQHVADTYRNAAIEISKRGTPVTPHQVQAVTWLHQQSLNQAQDEAGAAGHGGKGAGRGRQVMQQNAWKKWDTEAAEEGFPVNYGTTALTNDDIEWIIELGWQDQPRNSRGEWTRFGGVGQAADVMMKNREGFSVSVRSGKGPAHGYMVAQTDHTHTYPASILDDHMALTRAIDDMLVKEKSAFASGDTYLGGWVHDGKLWLEPSDNIASREEAVRQGRGRNQIAIWDVDNSQEIDTGGTGGGRIYEHANAQDGGWPGTGGLRGTAGSRAAGVRVGAGSGDPAGTILGQLYDLSWRDAWRHEARAPDGRWVHGAGGQALFGGLGRKPPSAPSFHRQAGAPDEARQKIIDQISDLSSTAFNHDWTTEDRHLQGALQEMGPDGDLAKAAKSLAAAAAAAEKRPGGHAWAAAYTDIARSLSSLSPSVAMQQDDARVQAVKSLASKSAQLIPGLMGGGAHENGWNGQVQIFSREDHPEELAELDWDGTLGIQDAVADALRDSEASTGTVEYPDAYETMLHELIHGVTPLGHSRSTADKNAYQDYAHAQIEEGFTELGAIHHAPDYLDQIGVGSRPTDVTDDSGHTWTVREMAESITDPANIAAGNTWGHYKQQTKDAQDWVQQVAMEEGWSDLRLGTPGHTRVVQLADDVNRQGTADKIEVMAQQMAYATVKEHDLRSNQDFMASLLGQIEQAIEDEWAKGQADAAREAFLKAKQGVQRRRVQAMKEIASGGGPVTVGTQAAGTLSHLGRFLH